MEENPVAGTVDISVMRDQTIGGPGLDPEGIRVCAGYTGVHCSILMAGFP